MRFNLSDNAAIGILFHKAKRTLGRARSTHRMGERVLLVLSAEDSIARLRTYNAVGRLYGKYAPLYDLEQVLKRLKSTPSVRRELCL